MSGRRARLQRKIAAEKRSLTVDRFMDQCMPMVCSAGYSHELARIVMSMFSWMVKKNMRGGCHLLSSVLYVALSEEGFNAELCIGECAEPDGTPFDHSWVTVDGKIIDLACYMPLVPHFVSYPIVLSIDVVTGGQPGITYGMTSGLRLSLDTQRVLSKSFCDYMDGYPNGNLWDVVSYVLGRPVDVSVLRAKYAAAVRNVVK